MPEGIVSLQRLAAKRRILWRGSSAVKVLLESQFFPGVRSEGPAVGGPVREDGLPTAFDALDLKPARYVLPSAWSWIVTRLLISKLRAPAGVRTTTSSPSSLPIKLLPTGDVVEIKPPCGSLSSGVTNR